jgi:hypothetical protein
MLNLKIWKTSHIVISSNGWNAEVVLCRMLVFLPNSAFLSCVNFAKDVPQKPERVYKEFRAFSCF